MAITAGVIKRALEEAESSDYFPYRVGAVIFKGSRIFGSGKNDVRSSQAIPNKYKNFKEALHAEQAAFINVKNNGNEECLKGSSILVIRQNFNTGTLSMGRPCDMCHAMLKKFGIRWMYYTDRKGQIVRERV